MNSPRLGELPVYSRLDLDVVRTEGAELLCRDGRRVLDLYGGHCVSALGGSPAEVGARVAEQWGRQSFLSNLFQHEAREEFLAAFSPLLPAGSWRAFFSNSGSEANENALKIALARTGRERVVAFAGAFHGRTAAASAASDLQRAAFPRAPFDLARVRFGDLEGVREALLVPTAAVLLEPIQSMAGVRVPPPGFLEGLRELCDASGAALVFDEVQTASGRTGAPFAATTFGVTPDLLTTAKGAAAGLPIGLTLASEAWAEGLPSGILGSTFGGGPTVLAAARLVADTVAAPGFLERVRASGEALVSAARRGPVREVRGAGLLLGLELEEGLDARDVRDRLLARDVLVGTSNDPRVLRLFPSLLLTPEQVGRFGDALADLGTSRNASHPHSS